MKIQPPLTRHEIFCTKEQACFSGKLDLGSMHMKKLLLTIVAFIYFGLAVRATVHLHDCIDIFSGSADTHALPVEKLPCNGDPKQCKFETEQRINEAAFKSYRVLDPVLLPVVVPFVTPRVCPSYNHNWYQRAIEPRETIPLFIFHRVILR